MIICLKQFLIGLLLTAACACMIVSCSNRNKPLSSEEIREVRTGRYLDRIATDAVIVYNDAREEYDEAYKKKKEADALSDTAAIRKYKSQCMEVKARMDRAKHNLDLIISYMNLLCVPRKDRTPADNAILDSIYDFCCDLENKGWNNTSSRFVEHMQALDNQ